MNIFIGLYFPLADKEVSIPDERGKLVRETKVDSGPGAVTVFLRSLSGPVLAVPMETRQVKGAIKAMPIQTDHWDAEGVARRLQTGWFRPVHGISLSAREMRAVLAAQCGAEGGTRQRAVAARCVSHNFGL